MTFRTLLKVARPLIKALGLLLKVVRPLLKTYFNPERD
jgi:hypothetical protein